MTTIELNMPQHQRYLATPLRRALEERFGLAVDVVLRDVANAWTSGRDDRWQGFVEGWIAAWREHTRRAIQRSTRSGQVLPDTELVRVLAEHFGTSDGDAELMFLALYGCEPELVSEAQS